MPKIIFSKNPTNREDSPTALIEIDEFALLQRGYDSSAVLILHKILQYFRAFEKDFDKLEETYKIF